MVLNESTQIIDRLNQSLQLEYSLIVHYPRVASLIEDEETRNLTLKLGSDSIKHADTVANAINNIGGTPNWSFELFPEWLDIVEIFQKQLEKEKLALQLHRQSVNLVHDSSLKTKFSELAKSEELHIKTVEEILSRLK